MKKGKTKIQMRIPSSIYEVMHNDLGRPHEFAYERVGFLLTRSMKVAFGTEIIIAVGYMRVEDEDYVHDNSVGAKISSDAIRKIMQRMFEQKCGCFHVHKHGGSGIPYPSHTDKESLPELAKSLSGISGIHSTGFLILSDNSFFSNAFIDKAKKPSLITNFSVTGSPMKFVYHDPVLPINKDVFIRQSFLGANSEMLFSNVRVGIVGYGGGGSHIGQQLAHIGIKNIVVFDEDHIEKSNLNRLIGGWFIDLVKKTLKTQIAKRVIKKILPNAVVEPIAKRWQEAPEFLHSCDIIMGNIDSYAEREQLEAECRRYLIPLIDIGMDVHKEDGSDYLISGQVIGSIPGCSCFKCFGFLTEENLAKEAAKYGKVGGRPQVVWPNGVLASTAVGTLVEMITGWTNASKEQIYLSYNGNVGTIQEHIRAKYAEKHCMHYLLEDAGPPVFKQL